MPSAQPTTPAPAVSHGARSARARAPGARHSRPEPTRTRLWPHFSSSQSSGPAAKPASAFAAQAPSSTARTPSAQRAPFEPRNAPEVLIATEIGRSMADLSTQPGWRTGGLPEAGVVQTYNRGSGIGAHTPAPALAPRSPPNGPRRGRHARPATSRTRRVRAGPV